jgi:hypothetical protein
MSPFLTISSVFCEYVYKQPCATNLSIADAAVQ